MAGRPEWLRTRLAREAALHAVTRAALQVTHDEAAADVPAVDREASWARLLAHASHCRAIGCTRAQIEQALDAGGLTDATREHEKAAYLAEIAAGLPDDLARIITGG